MRLCGLLKSTLVVCLVIGLLAPLHASSPKPAASHGGGHAAPAASGKKTEAVELKLPPAPEFPGGNYSLKVYVKAYVGKKWSYQILSSVELVYPAKKKVEMGYFDSFGEIKKKVWDGLIRNGYIDSKGNIQPKFDYMGKHFYLYDMMEKFRDGKRMRGKGFLNEEQASFIYKILDQNNVDLVRRAHTSDGNANYAFFPDIGEGPFLISCDHNLLGIKYSPAWYRVVVDPKKADRITLDGSNANMDFPEELRPKVKEEPKKARIEIARKIVPTSEAVPVKKVSRAPDQKDKKPQIKSTATKEAVSKVKAEKANKSVKAPQPSVKKKTAKKAAKVPWAAKTSKPARPVVKEIMPGIDGIIEDQDTLPARSVLRDNKKEPAPAAKKEAEKPVPAPVKEPGNSIPVIPLPETAAETGPGGSKVIRIESGPVIEIIKH